MTHLILIDKKINCVFIKHWGVHKRGDREASLVEVLAHPDFKKGMNIFQDVCEQPFSSEVNYKNINTAATRVMDRYDPKLGKCKWVTLVGDAQNYAKVHQFIMTGRLRKGSVERKVFREQAAAFEWLEVPVNYQVIYPDHDS